MFIALIRFQSPDRVICCSRAGFEMMKLVVLLHILWTQHGHGFVDLMFTVWLIFELARAPLFAHFPVTIFEAEM